MRIEEYFEHLRETIDNSPIVRTYTVTYDKRGTHEGFIRGEIYFIDDSALHLREFVDVEGSIERMMYVYHYLDESNNLIFRYDNTGHHRKLKLPSYPHHKHESSEENVIATSAPELALVLNEIEGIIPAG